LRLKGFSIKISGEENDGIRTKKIRGGRVVVRIRSGLY
jgi:hypothetical protein